MFKPSDTIRTSMGVVDAVLVVAAFLAGGYRGTLGSAIVAACAAGTAIGVWRAVRILGYLLEHARDWADADEVTAAD